MTTAATEVQSSRDAILAAANDGDGFSDFTVMVYGLRHECDAWVADNRELLDACRARSIASRRMFTFPNGGRIQLVCNERQLDGYNVNVLIDLGNWPTHRNPRLQVAHRNGVVISGRRGLKWRLH